MPIKIMKVLTGASENHKVHYNPRTVPKFLKNFKRLIFPFIEQYNISLNALNAYYTRPTSCDFIYFIDRGRTLILKDVAQLINIVRTNVLFHPEVFKSGLFLNYRDYCEASISVTKRCTDIIFKSTRQLTLSY